MRKTGKSRAHSIFRNQPSYKIFDKSFENPDDILYQQLNEIDPYFLSQEQLEDKRGFSNSVLRDPRTNEIVARKTINHSDDAKCHLFHGGGIKSALTKGEHDICLRVLLAWQEKREVDERDFIVWRRVQGKLIKEREQMQKFISEYAESHKEEMYAPSKRLDEYYKHWFRRKADSLLKKYPENIAFNTFTGLPNVNLCKNINNENAEICEVKLLERRGWLRIHSEDDKINWSNFNFRFEEHAESLNDTLDIDDPTKYLSPGKLSTELEDFEDPQGSRNCFLPLETILFLLTAGNYVDLPTECLLNIAVSAVDNGSLIKFESPLPARNCGMHTRQQFVEQTFATFVSKEGRSRWLQVDNENIQSETLQSGEIHADYGGSNIFKPTTIEQYLEKHCTPTPAKKETSLRSNSALIKWYLQASETTQNIKILTAIDLPPTVDESAKLFRPHETIKLEYKSQFGCEILTKYELLKVWLKIHLMSSSKTTDYGYCHRLSSNDFSTQLEERLSLEVVEHHLKNTYHVNPKQLIANLAEFLKLLFNMPPGRYMLRYSPKYADKFLLCSPAKELTQNTVYLHSLLHTEPNDILFMQQPQYLPIIETLCSVVHLKHRLLPCAFLPQLPHQKKLQTADAKAKKEKARLHKEEQALKKLETLKKNATDKSKVEKKRQKRRRQKQKKRDAEKKKREEEAETNKLLEF